MSDSPIPKSEEGKEAVAYTTREHGDIETADAGIVNKAAPLARKLQGRHMQMIAIGTCAFTWFPEAST